MEINIIQILLKDNRTNPIITNKRGGTPLHQAVVSGSISSVKQLLQDDRIKSSINITNSWGETALILSATRGDPHVAFVLLENGADRQIKDKWNQTAQEVAQDHGETVTSQLIRDYISGQTKPPATSQPKPPSTLPQKRILSKMLEAPLDEELAHKWLQDPSIDINGADYMRWTALHKVAAWEKPSVLVALLNHPDIIVDRPGMDGDTPLHSALSNGAVRCAAILIDDGRSSKTKANDVGVTPLMLAAALGDEALFTTLLEFGFVEQKTAAGKTAWNFAKENGHEGIARMLPINEMMEAKPQRAPTTKKLNAKLIAIQEAIRNGNVE